MAVSNSKGNDDSELHTGDVLCNAMTRDRPQPIFPRIRKLTPETGPLDFANHLSSRYPLLVSM